jgi:hypothetical protein
MKFFPATLFCASFLALAAPATAQWQSSTYSLKGGWNAIYLHGDATYATPDELFASDPEVLEIWRWNPKPTQVQFTTDPLIPSAGTPEWNVWYRTPATGETSNLTALVGQTSYLVKCVGTASDSHSVKIKHRPLPPSNAWVRNGANLLGFPSSTSTPTFSNYFATFPAAIAANTKIFKYNGGPLGPANPIQVFSPASEPLDRNQAYWFEAEVTGNYYAPLEISLSSVGGLSFGRTGEQIIARLRNRTGAPVTLTLASVAENPGDVPASQTGATAPVPLTRLTFNTETLVWTPAPIAAGASFTKVIGPQATVELRFGINRDDPAMAGAANGALFASFLRITDSGSLIDISLPTSARKDSRAGLWVGDIEVTDVSNRVSNPGRGIASLNDGSVTDLVVDGSGGYGYDTAPVVTIAPPAGTALASADLIGGTIESFAVTHPGFDYDTAPDVTVSAPAASTTATAIARLVDGVVDSLLVTDPGFYYPAPSVIATASATLTNDAVTNIGIIEAGFYYASAPVVTLSAPPTGTNATATASVYGGAITGFTITEAGTGYVNPPTVTIAAPAVTIAAPLVTVSAPSASVTATASASLEADKVSNLLLTEPGSFYASAPVVTLSASPSGTTATATATVFDGAVTGFTITEEGSGYTASPTVTIAAPLSPSTATAIATILDGRVTGFAILAAGSGYSTTPIVSVAAPPAPTTATATATLSGSVSGFAITEGGSGYTVAPAVTIAAPPAGGTTATATATLVGDAITTIAITDPGSGYLAAPPVTIASPSSGTTATADVVFVAIVTGVTISDAGSGYTSAPTIMIASPATALTATATATVANGSVAGFTISSPGSGYKVSPRVSIAPPPPLTGTSTARSFPLRTLLHVNDRGTSRLLSQVFLGQLDAAPDYAFGLCSRESLLKQDAKATAQRMVAAHMPPGQVIGGSGSVGSGSATYTITVPYNDATNPFVHKYHPDHDNKDARFDAIALPAGVSATTAKMSDGVEAPAITRVCTFTFTATGGSVISGTYSEILTGVHRKPIQLTGTFELRRASEIGTLLTQ